MTSEKTNAEKCQTAVPRDLFGQCGYSLVYRQRHKAASEIKKKSRPQTVAHFGSKVNWQYLNCIHNCNDFAFDSLEKCVR